MRRNKINSIISRREENLLREAVQETIRIIDRKTYVPTFRIRNNRRLMIEALIASDDVQDILFEHQMLLYEADDSNMTVADVLSAFEDTVSDMDNSMAKFISEIVEFSKEYAPEKVKKLIEKGQKELKDIESFNADLKDILAWFQKLKDLAGKTAAAVKEAKGKYPDSVKKMLQWLWSQKKDVMSDVMNHFKDLKTLYEKNETFKTAVDKIFGEVFKQAIIEMVKKAVGLIPYVDKLLSAAKLAKNVAEIGGKLKGIFSAFKKSSASPEEKFAAFAQKIIQGPDNPELGAIGRAIQLDDKLEATIDDKIEAEFVKFYIGKLKGVDPKTKVSDISANDMITKFIKQKQDGVVVQKPR